MGEHRVLELLDWDSRHFGYPVARVKRDLEETRLREALARARSEGVRLVYAFRSEGPALDAPLLSAFGGRRICTQLRFSKVPVEKTKPDVIS